MKKYYGAITIMKRKLVNEGKIKYINTELETMTVLINTNWDTFGWISTEGISKLFDIPLQKGVSSTMITEDIRYLIEEIHGRNSFCSCLR